MTYRRSSNRTLILLCLVVGLCGYAQAQEEALQLPEVNYFGELGWIVKYGLGDSRELSRRGFAPQLLFEQYIALNLDAGVSIQWPLAGTLSVSAQLDNRKGNNLQSFSFGFKGQSVEAAFKDFSMGEGSSDFAAADRLLKGFLFSWEISPTLKLSGKLARVEGIAESQIFRGNTSRETVSFTLTQPDRPWLEAPYLRNLRGLEYFQLRTYVAGFTTVSLRFTLTAELRTLLENYGLGYLTEIIEDDPEPELEAELYDVVTENETNFLVLKRESLELLRATLHTYIEDYNDEHDLFDEAAKVYPLAEGTDYEESFLTSLSKLVQLATPDEAFALYGAKRERFFSLGRDHVVEDSLKLEIKRQDSFVQLPDPDLPNFNFTLFAEQGLLALNFPEEFFRDPRSEVRVSFDYAVSGGLYVLGLAVLQNSERVYLNGKLLKRDVDYQMDYETGALLLLPPNDVLGQNDELKIEYELMRGGLGGFAEHQRNFYGLSLHWTPWPFLRISLDALRAADSQPSVEGRDRLRTMPNTHTVFSLAANLDLGDLKADLKAGYTDNVFPPGRNQRRNQRNQINAIATFEGRQVTFFGHQNGLLVYDGSRWQGFSTAHGLSGRGVRGIAIHNNIILFATDSGLSLVRLEAGRPVLESLAKPVNWKRFYRLDGLPHNVTNDVLIDEAGVVWVGTDEGLARVPLAQIEEKSAWKIFNKTNADRITELASDGVRIYVGTDKGLLLYDTATEIFTAVSELQKRAIHDLVALGATVYAATDAGVYELFDGQGIGWSVADLRVQAITVRNDELWYGTQFGLFRASSDAPVIQEYEITAIEQSARPFFWVGPKALQETYQIPLWQIDSSLTEYPQAETRLNGRDEFRFEDISPQQNTDHGWLAQLGAQYKLGALEITALLEGLTSEFLAIGRENRQDFQRLTVSARSPLGENLTLTGDHVMGFSERFRSFSVRDALRASWKPWADGPQLHGTVSLELSENDRRDRYAGFDTSKLSYGLKTESYKISDLLPIVQELALLASYEANYISAVRGRSTSEVKWGLSGSVIVLADLKLHGSYSSKTITGGAAVRRDSDTTWGGNWQYDLGFAKMNSQYTQTTRWRQGRGSFDENASMDLRFQDLILADVKLSATLSGKRSASLGGTTGLVSLSAEGRVSGQWQALSGSLGLKQTSSTDVRSARDLLKQELTGRIDWAVSPSFKPGLDLGLSLDTLTHPTLGRKQTWRHRARLSADWAFALWKVSVELLWQMTVSERERSTVYEIGSQIGWDPTEQLSLSLDAQASLDVEARSRRSLAGWELRLEGEYDLGTSCAPGLDDSTCSFSASVGYSGRLDPTARVPLGQGVFICAQLGLDF